VRLKFTLGYDGSGFVGWARQPELRTVQGEFERVLGHVAGSATEVVCAGRTDAGVHARGQVAHADLPDGIEAPSVGRLNRALPDDIRVRSVEVVSADFDARFSALWRRYSYRICDQEQGVDPLLRNQVLPWTKPLDEGRINAAAEPLLGEHDFAAFCRPRPQATTIRRLLRLECERLPDSHLLLHVVADAFCHSMVRSLVGGLLPVGDGRRPVTWPGEVLARGERDSAVVVMPPYPLVLEQVGYPPVEDLAKRQRVTRQVRQGS